MTARKTDPHTSHESAAAIGTLKPKLYGKILAVARKAARRGVTGNEFERRIPDHKNHSVTPRLKELVQKGALVRMIVGYGKPTKRFPGGKPRHFTRWDKRTRRNVIVYWAPEFAPMALPASAQGELFAAP